MTKIDFSEEFMRKITTFIYQCGKGIAPPDWIQVPQVDIQRLYYIKAGSGSMLLEGGGSRDFRPGRLYLIPSNMRHNFATDAADPINHIYFDFYTSPPIISDDPLEYEVKPTSPLAAHIELCDRLLRERIKAPIPQNFGVIDDAPSGSSDEYRQLCMGLLNTLLLLLSREGELPFTDDAVVSDAIDFMRSSLDTDITLELLADRAGFEKNYFSRRFKKVIGITPYAYLRTCRINRASELISQGETIVRAAAAVGYENASSLSRALKMTKNLR